MNEMKLSQDVLHRAIQSDPIQHHTEVINTQYVTMTHPNDLTPPLTKSP